jgi:DNA-binding NtrC family response regulator
MDKVNVLVLDGRPDFKNGLNGFFTRDTYHLHQAFEAQEAFRILDENDIDIAIMDESLDGVFGVNFMKSVKGKYPGLETVVIKADQKELPKSSEYQRGSSEYLSRPYKWLELKRSIEKTNSFSSYRKHTELLNSSFISFTKEIREKEGNDIIGISSAIKAITSLILQVAQSDDTSVLVTGESGTGKELIVRAIHTLSSRSKHPFCAVNCSAIPDTLFESEFFGYRRGAFTGASEKSMGWFELSNLGTLFLDEITELPLNLQAKFLRVLDDKIITRIGSHQEIKLNLRITAASNQDISRLLDKNVFREDLFHRLNAFHIHIPPLRDRKEDIPVLLDHFVGIFSEKLKKPIFGIGKNALEKLMEYSFPGNVRELKNLVERAIILTQNGKIEADHIQIASGQATFAQDTADPVKLFNLQEVEKEAISGALKQANFNKSKAARLLSISRQALDRKMAKFKIPSSLDGNPPYNQ